MAPAADFVAKGVHISPDQSSFRYGFDLVAGHTIGASVVVTGLSAGRGDKLIFVKAITRTGATGTGPRLGTPLSFGQASVSIAKTRIKISDSNQSGRNLLVVWWKGDGAQ